MSATSGVLRRVGQLSSRFHTGLPTAKSCPNSSVLANARQYSTAPQSSQKPASASTTAKPASPQAVPVTALNSTIVSQLTSRAGARPGGQGEAKLPPNYRSVARKVTMTIVALPIALVTSWVLYERLFQGQERKRLVPPGTTGSAEASTS